MKKRLLGILLSMLVLGLMPGMSLTAYADNQKAYAAYDVTTDVNKVKSGVDLTALQVTFNGKSWYIIEDNSTAVNAGTVTLLAADTSFGTSKFHDSSNNYSESTVKAVLDALTASGGSFANVANAIVTNSDPGGKLYLLSNGVVKSLPNAVLKMDFTGGDCDYGQWWFRPTITDSASVSRYVKGTYGSYGNTDNVQKVFGVRPALQLDLSKVTFDSTSNTISVSIVSVTGVTLNPSTAQTIDVDNKVSFTATVQPDNASDKKVKWSVGGTNSGAVKLYSDADCTTEVGTDATSTLTVYAKGMSAGSATVTATSNANSTKSPSCDVQVSAAAAHTHTVGEQTITFQPWTSTTSLPTSGNYYLTGDVTVSTKTTVSSASALNLCLNGYGIRMTGDDSVFQVNTGRTMNLYDCNESNSSHYVTLENWRGISVSDTGSASEVTDGNGVVNLNGGLITGGHNTNPGGGAFCVYGTFNMYGGTLLGNYARSGGAIWTSGLTAINGNSRIAYNMGTEGNRGGVYGKSDPVDQHTDNRSCGRLHHAVCRDHRKHSPCG